METPTPEQIAKLPKWVQDHIRDLERRTKVAERAVKEYGDTQTVSNVFYEDFLCIGGGSPKITRKYVQSDRITVLRDDIRLDVLLRQEEPGIEVWWSDEDRGMREIAMVPTSFQKMRLLRKDHMR